MRFLWSVAWRNLWRHRGRSFFTAFAMASAIALCWIGIAITDGFYGMIFVLAVEQQLGHVQVHHPAYPVEGVMYDTLAGREELITRIEAVEGTVAVNPRLEGFALVAGDNLSAGCQLIGIRPARDRLVTALKKRVAAGSYLSDAVGKEVLLGHKLAREIRVGVGDQVVLLTQSADGSMGNDLFFVAGLVKSGDVSKDTGAAWLHLDDAENLLGLHGQAHGITVLSDDVDQIDDY